MFTLNHRGKIILLNRPMVMGIVNVTPDSFYTGHLEKGEDEIMKLISSMVDEGADIIDIGGQSTRPGSERISADDELQRIIPVIISARSKYPDLIISVDTYYSVVAQESVAAGASVINDISGGDMDPEMIRTVGVLGVPYILMHMKGTPETMQDDPVYENVTREVISDLSKKVELCLRAGIKDIIIDPGFGFGKTIDHNFKLLHDLSLFKVLGKPLLAGLSRKGTIYKTLKVGVEDALNGTTVLNTIALLNGADILRVHDVKEAREVVKLIAAYKNAASFQEAAF